MSMSREDLRKELVMEARAMNLPRETNDGSEVVITIVIPASEDESIESDFIVQPRRR